LNSASTDNLKCGARIGIDLGGTKVEALILDHNGIERARKRLPTPKRNYTKTLNTIRELIEYVEQSSGLHGSIGVATPGVLSPATGLMKNANSTALLGHKLDIDLEDLLQRPVRLANDANCFALSEATDGAGRGHNSVFGVILGTGTGGGIVFNGEIMLGANAIGGEWGHNPLPNLTTEESKVDKCYCGRQGCIESFLSGPALERSYYKNSGNELSAADIDLAAQVGEESAEQTLQLYEDQLARGLGSIINIIDPAVVVLGGGVSNIERLYRNVPKLWDEHIFSDQITTKLLKAKHGDSSGVRGAAWLWN
jgi:fructokinase